MTWWGASCACVALATTPVFAQTRMMRRIGPQDGLVPSSVRSLAQDERGVMWIGTPSGLQRYDGRALRMTAIRNDAGTSVEVGFDRPGGDYASSARPSVASCQQACRDDAVCRAFSYAAGTCFLKSMVPDWFPSPGVTAGIALQLDANVDRAGGYLYSVDIGTQPAETCINRCAAVPNCYAYTYVPAGAHSLCWLKSSVPAVAASRRRVLLRLCARDARGVAARLRVVDVQVARGGGVEQPRDRRLELLAIDDLGVDQHAVAVERAH